MKKLIVLIIMILWLTGCSQPAWETVHDTMDVPAVSWIEEAYSIEISVPRELQLLDETADGWRVYSTADGSFEVETRIFPASDLAAAARMLTGYEVDRLNILQTERFDLPEYQFAWVSQTDRGQRLSRADLVIDGTDCYAVVCSTLEESGDAYSEDVQQVMATFGLYVDEGV